MEKFKWKNMIKKAIKPNYENELKSKANTSKLKDGPMTKESFIYSLIILLKIPQSGI
jgi:hypothetical protein